MYSLARGDGTHRLAALGLPGSRGLHKAVRGMRDVMGETQRCMSAVEDAMKLLSGQYCQDRVRCVNAGRSAAVGGQPTLDARRSRWRRRWLRARLSSRAR